MNTKNLSNEKLTERAAFELQLDPLANFFNTHTFAMKENDCTTTYNIQSAFANKLISSTQRFTDFRKRLSESISISNVNTIRIHFTVYDMSNFFERGETSHARIVVTGPKESSIKENLMLFAGVIEDLPNIIKRDFERYLNFYLKVLKIAVEEATFNNEGIKVACDFKYGKVSEFAYDFIDKTFRFYHVMKTDIDRYCETKPLESVEDLDIMRRMYPDDMSTKPSESVKMDIDEADDETERSDDEDGEAIANLDMTIDPLKLLLEHWPYYESYEIVTDESVELFDKDHLARILKDDIEMAKATLASNPRYCDMCCTFCAYRELEIDTIKDEKYQKYKTYIPSVATKLALAIYDVLCEQLPIARIVVETYNTLLVRYSYPIDAHRLYVGKPTMEFKYVGDMGFEYKILDRRKILPGLEQMFTNLMTTVVAHLDADVKSCKIELPTSTESKSIADNSEDSFVKIDPLEILLIEYPMQEDYWEFKNGNREIDRELIRCIIQERLRGEITDECGHVIFVIDHYDEIHLTYAATKENQRSFSYLRQMVNDMTSLICNIITEEAIKDGIDKWEIQKQQNPMISIIEDSDDVITINCPTNTIFYKDKSFPLSVKDLEAFYTGEEDFEVIPKIYNPNRIKVRYMLTIDPFEILLNLLSNMEKSKASAFMNGVLDLDKRVFVNYIDDYCNGVFTWLNAAGKHHPYELDYEVCYSDTINIRDYRQTVNNFRVKDLIDSAQTGKLTEVLETITRRMVDIISRHFHAVFTSYRRYKCIDYTIQNDCVSITTESSSVYVVDKNPSINLLSDLYDKSTGITIKDVMEITKQHLLSSMHLKLHEVDGSTDESNCTSSDTPTMLGKQETYAEYQLAGYDLKANDKLEQLLDDDDDVEESMEEEEDDGFNVIQVPYDPLELFYNACNRGLDILGIYFFFYENIKGWVGRLQSSPIDIFNQFFGVIFRESFVWDIFPSSSMVKNKEAFEKYL